jgi:hypothetical protein
MNCPGISFCPGSKVSVAAADVVAAPTGTLTPTAPIATATTTAASNFLMITRVPPS